MIQTTVVNAPAEASVGLAGLGAIILLLPLVAFAIIGLLTHPHHRVSSYLSIVAVAVAFVLSLAALAIVIGGQSVNLNFPWFKAGGVTFPLGLVIDGKAAMMLVVVTFVSLLVQVYSQGYLAGDRGYSRFYAFLSLFTFSMLGIVLAPNFLQMYVFWELVGLSSYLLIGFWFALRHPPGVDRPSPAAAAKKAFVVTRIGDLGFLIGILIFVAFTGTFEFHAIEAAISEHRIEGAALSVALILVFMGAVGKSAQFPLHVWLPDAMEGPTPVSALIHAATMVAAGVYLVARTFELFHHSPTALAFVAYTGAFTAIFAATMGLVSTDIKGVMAYSTISQLGYMMAGLGVGSVVAGLFHLFTHAFFKALLFLCAGSVIHSAGTQDLRQMGGLGRPLRTTAICTFIGAWALAGIPPLAGFWSKDELLLTAFSNGFTLIFTIMVVTAFMTSFYAFRMWFLAFAGPSRAVPAGAEHGTEIASPDAAPSNGHASEKAHGDRSNGRHTLGEDADVRGLPVHAHVDPLHPHESPLVMVAPLVILAFLSCVVGFLGAPFLGSPFATLIEPNEHPLTPNAYVVLMGSGAALLGFGLASIMYWKPVLAPASARAALRPLADAAERKWYVDALYEQVIGYGILAVSRGWLWFDLNVIDRVVNGVGQVTASAGNTLRAIQTGRVQNYGLAIYVGVVILAVFIALRRL